MRRYDNVEYKYRRCNRDRAGAAPVPVQCAAKQIPVFAPFGGPAALFLLFAGLILLLGACTADGESGEVSSSVVASLSGSVDEGYARAYEPFEFRFPLDHGPHPEYQTEWWYYTGNLRGENGEEFGYQFTIFRSAIAPEMVDRSSDLATNQIYMAHFALTDVAAKEHQGFDRYSRGAAGLAGALGEPQYEVWLEDWSAREVEPGVVRIEALAQGAEGPVAIDLVLSEERTPIYHGNAGLSQKGPESGNASYYCSLVGLETSGQVRSGDEVTNVSGMSWMDHEFGTSSLSADTVGWDWFSVQLEDGTALMFAQLRTVGGNRSGDVEGTIAYADGRQEVIRSSDSDLTVTGEWTSPATDITYPSGWEFSMPDHDLELTVTPLIPDQEMQVSYVYWEGAVEVAAQMAGRPLAGRGYVELTGYGAQPNTVQTNSVQR